MLLVNPEIQWRYIIPFYLLTMSEIKAEWYDFSHLLSITKYYMFFSLKSESMLHSDDIMRMTTTSREKFVDEGHDKWTKWHRFLYEPNLF